MGWKNFSFFCVFFFVFFVCILFAKIASILLNQKIEKLLGVKDCVYLWNFTRLIKLVDRTFRMRTKKSMQKFMHFWPTSSLFLNFDLFRPTRALKNLADYLLKFSRYLIKSIIFHLKKKNFFVKKKIINLEMINPLLNNLVRFD